MMYCYVVSDDGYTLINEQGRPVGCVINLDKQILDSNIKSLKTPSKWFNGLVYKKLKGKMSA